MTVEEFARAMHAEDYQVFLTYGEADNVPERFEDLSEDEREGYLKEAQHYITNVPKDKWPDCVLKGATGHSSPLE